MCGIFAFQGKIPKNGLLKGFKALELLEYRGYDSCGIAFYNGRFFEVLKSTGYVKDLKNVFLKKYKHKIKDSSAAIFHTRWATHGNSALKNTHPHCDCTGNFFVVHNGIIENFNELKLSLSKKGHKFYSDTDTEVIPHLLEDNYSKTNDIKEAFLSSVRMIKGTFGLVAVSNYNPNVLMTARFFSPLHIGIGNGFMAVASDANVISYFTNKIITLNDNEAAFLESEKVDIKNFYSLKNIRKKFVSINFQKEFVSKNGYDTFMLKEIFEQPYTLQNSYKNRIDHKNKRIVLGAFEEKKEVFKKFQRVKIIGCGSSFNAGFVAKYFFEEVAKMPCEVEWASEFCAREPIIEEETLYLFISQSGETADTISALRKVKKRKGFCVGIVNNINSTISREVDCGLFNYVGPEIGVASTKTTTSQILVLALVGLWLGQLHKTVSKESTSNFISGIKKLRENIEEVLKMNKKIAYLADKYKNNTKFLFIGRHYNLGAVLEGALKLKEISYIPSEGYGAGEMKHGPLAMIEKGFPVFAVCFQDKHYEKMFSNAIEVKSRGGKVLALANYGDKKISKIADETIFFGSIKNELINAIKAIVFFQLFAYYMGRLKGLNVDRPRNLAKSVTVQ